MVRSMLTSCRRCFLALLISCTAHTSFAVDLEFFTEEFPPYNFLDNNVIKGINADLLYEACEHAGLECRFNIMPWPRAMSNALETPNGGLFSTSFNKEREASFNWIGPLVSSYTCFYRLSSRNDIMVSEKNDLKTYTVGIARSDIYQHVLNKMGLIEDKHYLTYSKKHEDARMFKLQKLDLIIGSSLTLDYQLNQVGLNAINVSPVMEIIDEALKGNYLAVNLNVEQTTLDKLQSSIEHLKYSGRITQIIAKYIKTNASESVDPNSPLHKCVSGSANY